MVSLLKTNEFGQATKLWNKGVRMTFPKSMIRQAKEELNIELLKWLFSHIRPEICIDDLKWCFEYADIELISIVWKSCKEPDLIEVIDIIEIILKRNNLILLLALSILWNRPNGAINDLIRHIMDNPDSVRKIFDI
jgi:hypothetical protein